MTKYLRKATLDELPTITQIFLEAKAFLKASGSPQWQNGAPNQATFKEDIQRGQCYVLIVDDQIGGMSSLVLDPDPNYQVIYEGSWQDYTAPYIAIHRVATSAKFRGHHLSETLFACLFSVIYAQGIRHVRIDTHAQNKIMQHIAQKMGFSYRGIIEIQNEKIDPKRKAYELKLK